MTAYEIVDQKDSNSVFLTQSTLKKGKLAVLPTNTAYGLCGNAQKDSVVKKVFEVKKRPFEMPISVFMTRKMIKKYIKPRDNLDRIFSLPDAKYRTAILEIKADVNISKYCLNKEGNLGVRLSPTVFLDKILKNINIPITATSANISGNPTPYSLDEVLSQDLDVSLIIDGGKLSKGTQTEIIDYTKTPPKIIRPRI